MEVESTDSLSAGAAGSFNFGAAVPGAMPDSRSSESGDANNERLNAHGSTADADPLIDSGDTEPDLTLDEVIDRLVVPHIMSDRWNFLIGEDRRRRIDMTPAQFMNALLKYFDPEFLVRSGPFERVGEHVQLIASLNGDTDLLVEIDESDNTIKLTSDDETLVPAGHTALQCALQHKPDACAEPTRNLYVVGTVEEVETLKWLKLAAVLSDGLETMRKSEIEALFAGNHRTDADWQYDLILVDFDIANLANRPAATIGAITKRLTSAALVYPIDASRRFTMLRPTANEFELIEQAVAFEDSATVCQVLETWAEAAKRTRFGSGIAHDRREAPTFLAASQELTCLLQSDTRDPARVREALEAYRATGQDPIILKFHQQVELTSNPFTRISLLSAAR